MLLEIGKLVTQPVTTLTRNKIARHLSYFTPRLSKTKPFETAMVKLAKKVRSSAPHDILRVELDLVAPEDVSCFCGIVDILTVAVLYTRSAGKDWLIEANARIARLLGERTDARPEDEPLPVVTQLAIELADRSLRRLRRDIFTTKATRDSEEEEESESSLSSSEEEEESKSKSKSNPGPHTILKKIRYRPSSRDKH